MKKNITFMIIFFVFSFFFFVPNAFAWNHSVTLTNYSAHYNGNYVSATTFVSNFQDFSFVGIKSNDNTYGYFNTAELEFSINNPVNGIGYTAFTLYYMTNDNSHPTVRFDGTTCTFQSSSTIELPLGTSANTHFANYSCYGYVGGNLHVDMGAQNFTFVAISQIIDISGAESDLLEKLDELKTAIENISVSPANIQDIKDNTNAIKSNTNDIKDSINSDSTTGAESSADDLVNNSAFNDTTGLSAIISMPLTFVNTLSNSCSPISLTIPYMDYPFQLPCIQSIVNHYAPALVVIIKVIVNGLIIYWVMLDIFKIVKNAKNPDDDRIEVLDL